MGRRKTKKHLLEHVNGFFKSFCEKVGNTRSVLERDVSWRMESRQIWEFTGINKILLADASQYLGGDFLFWMLLGGLKPRKFY